jgi:hypothetical protein
MATLLLPTLSLYAPRSPIPRSPIPRPRSRPAVASAEDDFFAATTYMTYAAVELRSGADGNSLVASRDAAAGDRLLEVPRDCCLTAHRSGVIGGLIGQTDLMYDAAGDLRDEVGEEMFGRGATWDVRLALAVLEATNSAGGEFWDLYRRLLPLPVALSTPTCLPPSLLPELHDETLSAKAAARRDELAALYPPLADAEAHPATTMYLQMGAPPDAIPSPLAWAHALVVSRCFTCADGDTFGFVPILDLCEHAAAPSANFSSTADGGFQLRALRPIAAGEAVTISYGGDYDSRRLMEQYGFSQPEGNANDARWLTELAKAADGGGGAPAEGERLLAAYAAHADSGLDSPERRAALFDALAADDAPPPGAMLAGVRAERDRWPTSLADDEAERQAIDDGARVDPRVVAVLDYRIARKRQAEYAERVLATYLSA